MVARFDELFERHYLSTTPESASLAGLVCSLFRAENRETAVQPGRYWRFVCLSAVALLGHRRVGGRRNVGGDR
ncbi:hypothetical protein DIJ64_07010 [Mycobacterium leprae]|uniref:Uncharacterized protein n=1 Tax=Mycobacterium leprae TaxID=1769 RepID=A0AAD0KWC4_MYCLR|nr:hypothetical protein DIJ64_07010 [Mycobacterium leprae]OAR19601.1 hypothetical protein A8144_13995 [Mycobacterium leprae 3125609]OAX70101.1 hypothetical protein A3216_14020 [Mycobacterium leprae 7935681]